MTISNSSPVYGAIDNSFKASIELDMKDMEALAKKAEQGSLDEAEMIRYNSMMTRWSTKVGLLAKITSTIDDTLKNIVNR